jgi:hypothetical protein
MFEHSDDKDYIILLEHQLYNSNDYNIIEE